MSNLGIGVMLGMLSSNKESVNALKNGLNKEIKDIVMVDNGVTFTFSNDTTMTIFDDGQSCCEYRYMATDDAFADYIGAQILDYELKDAPDIEDGGEVHEVQFLEVKTTKGALTFQSHNEHNGYYGGFLIRAK